MCKQAKPLSEFHLTKSGARDGRFSYCKPCRIAYTNRWKKSNPERALEMSRKYILAKRFGITLSDYDAMLERCGGVCQICGKPESQTHRNMRLAVDHCHKTGKVRGLLCSLCNTAIGKLNDDPAILQRAIDYLNDNGAKHDCA